MNATSKKTERQRDMHIATSTLEMALSAALLTADDVFGLTDELTDRFTKGYAEVVNGYTQCGGIKAIKAELADRGIEICLDGKRERETTPYKHQRGVGEWVTTKDKNGKKKRHCSHCKKGNAIRTPYCGWCGADLRPKENNNA